MDLTAIPDDFKGLIARARAVTVARRLSETATCGTVGAALETAPCTASRTPTPPPAGTLTVTRWAE